MGRSGMGTLEGPLPVGGATAATHGGAGPMVSRIWRRAGVLGVLALIGGLVPAVPAILATAPAHALNACTLLDPCLEVTPEMPTASIGTGIQLTATMTPPPTADTTINFEIA